MCRAIDTSNVRLVVCDYDGTIGGSDAVATSVLAFLHDRPEGLQFTVASGRIHGSLAALGVSRLCSAPLITEGGGRIINPVTGETLFARPVEEDALLDFCGRVESGDVDLLYACFSPNGQLPYTFYLPSGGVIPPRYAPNAHVIPDLTKFLQAAFASKACKVNFRTRDHGARPSWPGVHWNEGSADLVANGVDKGTAVAWLCERLGLRLNEVMVIGNDHNDGPMLRLKDVIRIIVGNIFSTEETSKMEAHLLVDTPEALGETLRLIF